MWSRVSQDVTERDRTKEVKSPPLAAIEWIRVDGGLTPLGAQGQHRPITWCCSLGRAARTGGLREGSDRNVLRIQCRLEREGRPRCEEQPPGPGVGEGRR